MKKILILALTAALTLAAPSCKVDTDCSNSGLCVRSVCLSTEQLKQLATVYAPKEAIAKVTMASECKMMSDCDEPFDRCFKGMCLSTSDVAQYQKEASELFTRRFGEVSAPKAMTFDCVTDGMCIPGDLCFEGYCIPYFAAQVKL